MTPEELKARTESFGLQIIQFVESLPTTQTTQIIGKQLVRSGLGVGANYRSACRARSPADFVSKIRVTEEEADETCYWLGLLRKSNIANGGLTERLMKEAEELTAIFTASGLTAKRKRR